MGNSNKKKKTDTTSKVGRNFSCPLCNKVFTSTTTFNTVSQSNLNDILLNF